MTISERRSDRYRHPTVAVIHYASPATVRSTVESVLSQSVQASKVLLIDNASPDGSGELLAREYRNDSTIEVLRMRDNRGYGAAFNEARSRSLELGDEPLLVLTHDVVLTPTTLETLVDTMASHSLVGAVGPLLYRADNGKQMWSAGGRLVGGLLRPALIRYPQESAYQPRETARPVDWLDGAAVLYRREALLAAGPMDEEYFLYYEDVDYCTSLRHLGWEVVCAARAEATQNVGTRSRYLAERNYLRFVRRHGSRWQSRRALVSECRQLVRDSLAAAIGRGPKWWIGGYFPHERFAGIRDYVMMRFGRGAFEAPATERSPEDLSGWNHADRGLA